MIILNHWDFLLRLTHAPNSYCPYRVRIDDWDLLVRQAQRHRMTSMIGRVVPILDGMPNGVRRSLSNSYRYNRTKLNVFYEFARVFLDALSRRGIKAAVRKGMALEHTVYGANGLREMYDLDILVHPKDVPGVQATLHDVGYAPGYHDESTGRIMPVSRRVETLLRLHPDHLPKHWILTGRHDVPAIAIDVCFSLSWHGSGFSERVKSALDTTETAAGMDVLSPIYMLYDVVLHAYREAWFLKISGFENDVRLSRFADIIALSDRCKNLYGAGCFASLVRNTGATNAVSWILTHADRVFNTSIVSILRLVESEIDEQIMRSSDLSSEGEYWNCTMSERLQSFDRRSLMSKGAL